MYTENTENEIIITIIISDPKQVSIHFSNYFVAVAKKLTKKVRKANNKYQDYLKNPNEQSIYLTETQIKNLNCKKASDIFDISANFLKFAGDKI